MSTDDVTIAISMLSIVISLISMAIAIGMLRR